MMTTGTGPSPRGAAAIAGLHLLVLGHLILRSRLIPGVLGVLVMVAGVGCTADGVGAVLSADYDAGLTKYTFAGEVLLMLWLLWRTPRLPATPREPAASGPGSTAPHP